MKKWKCTVCGYVHEGEEPPETCPICGADRSKFELVEEPSPPLAETTGSVDSWKCGACGYIHRGASRPEACSVCGADGGRFEPVAERSENAAPTTIAAEPASAGRSASPAAKASKTFTPEPAAAEGAPTLHPRLAALMQRYHAHPIAVHIPNGVLPVSMLFMALALLFGSRGLATAAFCNLVVVTLAMPLVLFTGYVDWRHVYGGNLTKIFKIKILCGVTVSLISLTLTILWLVKGDPLAPGASGRAFFIFLCLGALAAAATAGYYGGKLVFPNRKS